MAGVDVGDRRDRQLEICRPAIASEIVARDLRPQPRLDGEAIAGRERTDRAEGGGPLQELAA